MHDAIEATRKFLLKRTSISKNNRKILPRYFLIKAARFPELFRIWKFFGIFTISAHPLRAVIPGRIAELFFIFLLASDAIDEKFPGRVPGEYRAMGPVLLSIYFMLKR
ncbi:hypothetical protein [Burkholderia cepacia]|uniref:hypothetical protein n=1 Tax=Burkholderia cepacia TaxID=292 RepID=UPI000B32B9E0|nr:hypothetical protein [Burkholderia cepacia]